MQTFLPHADFRLSAESLDNTRLHNQYNEAKVILKTLLGGFYKKGWPHHPATKMWRGHEGALTTYMRSILNEWARRGGDAAPSHRELDGLVDLCDDESFELPPWLGDDEVHESHRSNLALKLPQHYQPQWPDSGPGKPYVWPV